MKNKQQRRTFVAFLMGAIEKQTNYDDAYYFCQEVVDTLSDTAVDNLWVSDSVDIVDLLVRTAREAEDADLYFYSPKVSNIIRVINKHISNMQGDEDLKKGIKALSGGFGLADIIDYSNDIEVIGYNLLPNLAEAFFEEELTLERDRKKVQEFMQSMTTSQMQLMKELLT